MKILSIDTSSDICSVCLLNNTTPIQELHLNNGKTHSENLVPLIKELMEKCNISFPEIDLIAVNKGPGSFTGIRIGIATIKAISEIHNIEIIGVTSLESLSYNIKNNTGTIISLIDARNNQVYCGIFNSKEPYNKTYYADDINKVLNDIKEIIKEPITFIGNGAILHKELIQKNFPKNIYFSEQNEQSSISTGLVALDIYNSGIYENADTILPFYLRKSQAERMKEINKNGNTK